MPPKTRISRESIVGAAFEIARREGAEKISARTVAQALGCSTQPVMYHFATIGELKRAVYETADRFHTEYLMNVQGENPMLSIGLNYIRFAVEETNLFRFLFQSGSVPENSIADMIDSGEMSPVMEAMEKGMGLSRKGCRSAFLVLSLFTHGYACMLSNNGMRYDEKEAAEWLERAFHGAVLSAKEEER